MVPAMRNKLMLLGILFVLISCKKNEQPEISINKCQADSIAVIRESVGQDAIINYQITDEIAKECRDNPSIKLTLMEALKRGYITEYQSLNQTEKSDSKKSKIEIIENGELFPENRQMNCKFSSSAPIDKNYVEDVFRTKGLSNSVVYTRKNNSLIVISSDDGLKRLEHELTFEKSDKEVVSPLRIVYGTSFRNSNAIATFTINEENSLKSSIGLTVITPYINGFLGSFATCNIIK
jgi:hypothetical protein